MANKKYKVLLVEDDPDQVMMYQAQFEQDGLKFFGCKNYSGAKAIIDQEKPDIILLDLLLGGESGEDILKQLKKEKITDKIPVFIFTNLRSDKDQAKFLQLGARGYWPKTKYLPRQLSELIKKYLAK